MVTGSGTLARFQAGRPALSYQYHTAAQPPPHSWRDHTSKCGLMHQSRSRHNKEEAVRHGQGGLRSQG